MAWIEAAGHRHLARVLCLDKDGLLFDSDVFWNALREQREKELAQVLDTDGIAMWRSLSGVTPIAINRRGPFALAYPHDEAVIAASVLYAKTGLPWDQALDAAEMAFRRADEALDLRRALHPLPGFPDILHRAKAAGLAVAVVTSDDETRTERSLTIFGVRDLIDLVCTPASVGRGKPHPDMLHHVARTLRCSPADLAMVGDSLVDLEMASRAGAFGIAVPHPDDRKLFAGYVVVNRLDEIVIR